MGWNCWDCFGTTVTEKQILQQTDFMAEKLKSHGWEYMVVDIQWYQPTATDMITRMVPNSHRPPKPKLPAHSPELRSAHRCASPGPTRGNIQIGYRWPI